MLHSRSRNSYMMSPRSVTAQPIGMPLRILKFAMDFFARVITAFWPVIWPSSCAAVSRSFAFWLASPRPILTVILETLGTAIMFFQPKRFISAGVVSLRYFSCNRLFIFPKSLLIQSRSTAAAGANFLSIGQNGVADAGVLSAAGADDQHVRDVHRAFFFHNAALDVLVRIRARVTLDDVGVLHNNGVLRGIHGQYAPALAGVAPGHHLHLVALANLNSYLFCCLCAHFSLPNFRSERDDLRELLLAQLSCHRPEHAGADGLICIVDQNRGVIVKADVGAILAARLLAHANDDALHDFSFLDLAFRRGFFHRRGDNVAESGFQSGIAADGQNAHQLSRAGIVGHRQPGSHLNHGFSSLRLLSRRVPRRHFRQAPALELGERPRGRNPHGVARL